MPHQKNETLDGNESQVTFLRAAPRESAASGENRSAEPCWRKKLTRSSWSSVLLLLFYSSRCDRSRKRSGRACWPTRPRLDRLEATVEAIRNLLARGRSPAVAAARSGPRRA